MRASGPRAGRRPTSVAERMASPHVALLWLVRLRWHALVAVALAMALAQVAMGATVAALPALGVVAGIALSNVVALFWARSDRPVRTAALGVMLLVDTVWLTAALALSGGAENPFVILYVIEITLAALLLPKRWVGIVGLACVAAYGILLAQPHALVAPSTESSLLAVAITLAINATLVVRVVNAYRDHQEALARAQKEAAQAEKLASLTTLAAGAAHELATPLGSIAVASTELEELIETAPEQALAEARSIREEVTRCKDILQRLGARAGSEPGEMARRTTSGEALERVLKELAGRARRVDLDGAMDLVLDAPVESLASVLASLVSNGLQASNDDGRVELAASTHSDQVRFMIRDGGSGIPEAMLPRLGEPFFTTKAPGQGMGLGLFLAFRFARACGGQLNIESTPGVGTRVCLDLPGVREEA